MQKKCRNGKTKKTFALGLQNIQKQYQYLVVRDKIMGYAGEQPGTLEGSGGMQMQWQFGPKNKLENIRHFLGGWSRRCLGMGQRNGINERVDRQLGLWEGGYAEIVVTWAKEMGQKEGRQTSRCIGRDELESRQLDLVVKNIAQLKTLLYWELHLFSPFLCMVFPLLRFFCVIQVGGEYSVLIALHFYVYIGEQQGTNFCHAVVSSVVVKLPRYLQNVNTLHG